MYFAFVVDVIDWGFEEFGPADLVKCFLEVDKSNNNWFLYS